MQTNGFWASNLRPTEVTKIVSTVPSQTELLFYLGLEQEVVGLTHFCVHPKLWHKTKTRIGGTKNLNIETIQQLVPNLIVANKEENIREQIEELATTIPVYVTDVTTVASALEMINEVGTIIQRKYLAHKLSTQLFAMFQAITIEKTHQVAYFIWKEPYMTVGGDTFISDMLAQFGFQNYFGNQQRYPIITIEELQQANIDAVFLSSEPYPFKEKHVEELQQLLPNTAVHLVDGELFSWYGSRMLHTFNYVKTLQEELSAT